MSRAIEGRDFMEPVSGGIEGDVNVIFLKGFSDSSSGKRSQTPDSMDEGSFVVR
jgi:hypothetical protein